MPQALELYVWNAEMSGALFNMIHYVEVVLRNALFGQIIRLHSSTGSSGEWYERADWFNASAMDDIDRARRRLLAKDKPVTAARVLTELPLGFWRYLMSRAYHRVFWEPGFRYAFPNLPNAIDRRGEVADRIEHVYLLRNRIAHHEPVFSRDHATDQVVMLELLGWTCVSTREWVEARSTILTVSNRRPYLPPSSVLTHS